MAHGFIMLLDMEPKLVTAPELSGVLAEQEPAFAWHGVCFMTAADSLLESRSLSLPHEQRARCARTLEVLRTALSPEEYQAALRAGEALSRQPLVAEAAAALWTSVWNNRKG